MCGRATLAVSAEEIAEIFDVDAIDIGPPRFNLAPTQALVTVRSTEREGRSRRLALVRWGLIPWWAKAEEAKKIGARCVQARSETAPSSPAYRDAFKRQRCLVVVDGFYEWKTLPDGRRVPYHVRRSGGAPLAIAGLWDHWRTEDSRIESGTVLTTPARGALASVHDRMPLVLPREQSDGWRAGDVEEARKLLREGSTDGLVVVPVSTHVNDVKHDDPECIVPANPAQVLLGIKTKKRARSERG